MQERLQPRLKASQVIAAEAAPTAGIAGIEYLAADAAPTLFCEFFLGLNRLALQVQPAHWNWPENVLRTRDGGISIPPRLAGLGIQGFPGVWIILAASEKAGRVWMSVA